MAPLCGQVGPGSRIYDGRWGREGDFISDGVTLRPGSGVLIAYLRWALGENRVASSQMASLCGQVGPGSRIYDGRWGREGGVISDDVTLRPGAGVGGVRGWRHIYQAARVGNLDASLRWTLAG